MQTIDEKNQTLLISSDKLININGLQMSKRQQQMLDNEEVHLNTVSIIGLESDIKEQIESKLTIRSNSNCTIKNILADAKCLLMTGYIKAVKINGTNIHENVDITYDCQVNPKLVTVSVNDSYILKKYEVDDLFRPHLNKLFDRNEIIKTINGLNEWYQSRGYYGQVFDVKYDLYESGSAKVGISETLVDKLTLRYLKSGEDNELKCSKGRTRKEAILRHINIKGGKIFNEIWAKKDIESLYNVGLYESVSLERCPQSSTYPYPAIMDIIINIVEKKTRGLNLGVCTFRNKTALTGDFSYNEENIFGTNQNLNLSFEVSKGQIHYGVNYLDPWIVKSSQRISRNITASYDICRSSLQNQNSANSKHLMTKLLNSYEYSYLVRESGLVEWTRSIGNFWRTNQGLKVQHIDYLNKDINIKDKFNRIKKMKINTENWSSFISLQVIYDNPNARDYFLFESEKEVAPPNLFDKSSKSLNPSRTMCIWDQEIKIGNLILTTNVQGVINFDDILNRKTDPGRNNCCVRSHAGSNVYENRPNANISGELRWSIATNINATTETELTTC